MDTISMSLKISMLALGSISGSATAFAFVPAETTRDGMIKWLACCLFTCCVSPAIVHGLVRVIGVSDKSIADVLLALACVTGLCSQWIINALIDLSRQDGKAAIRNVAVAFFPWLKSTADPPQPSPQLPPPRNLP